MKNISIFSLVPIALIFFYFVLYLSGFYPGTGDIDTYNSFNGLAYGFRTFEPISWSIIWVFSSNFLNQITLLCYLIHIILTFLSGLILKNGKGFGNLKLFILILITVSNFYLLLSFNILRQGISLIFILYSLLLCIKGKKILPYFIFFLAVFSHTSAILFAPLIAIFTSKNGWLLALSAVIIIFVFKNILLTSFGPNVLRSDINNQAFIYLLIPICLLILHVFSSRTSSTIQLDNTAICLAYISLIGLALYDPNNNKYFERISYSSIPISLIMFAYQFKLKLSESTKFLYLCVIFMSIIGIASTKAVYGIFI